MRSGKLRASTHNLFASVFDKEDVPQQWNKGDMVNLSKPKGDKEMLTNKRGLTLTSNVGKLFERVLNNRVVEVLPFSEAQAGGRPGRCTVDQHFILHEVVKQRRSENKPTYCAFLDVHKAYDKAWRGIILHILWEADIRGKLWRLLHLLNSDITAQIRTRFGLTRIINVNGGVKQGGVLSVGQFAKMIDELNAELVDADLGVHYNDLLISCLMFVDDVILIADSAEDLQKSLDVCFKFFCMCHLQISQVKSNIVVFNKKARTLIRTWTFGPLVLEEVNFYKYLGYVLMANLSCKDNMQHKRGLIEAALATCMAVASHEVLHHITLETLLQLYNTCIVQIILHGTEMWTESSYDSLEQLQTKCLKRLLKIPTSTPNPATVFEFGNLPIQILVERRQLGFYHKLKSSPNSLAGKILAIQEESLPERPHSWANHIHKVLNKYELVYVEGITKDGWKHLMRKPTNLHGNVVVTDQAGKLSKMSRLLGSKNQIRREEYITSLPLFKARLLFKARCRMLNLKNNFRSNSPDLLCELCHTELEDDDHLFDRCPVLEPERSTLQIRRDELFENDTPLERMSVIADFLIHVEKKLRKL